MLTIALPRGRLFQPIMEIFQEIGIIQYSIDSNSRQLVHLAQNGSLKIILAKPIDVPTFVEAGVADLGVAGKDVLREGGQTLYELQDMKLGECRMVVAALEDTISSINQIPFHSTIATTYTQVAQDFFAQKGLQVDIIKLHGGVEAAPRLGLSDLIVDITSTGETLQQNRLTEIAHIFSSTARLIANQGSYRSQAAEIQHIWKKVQERVKERKKESKHATYSTG